MGKIRGNLESNLDNIIHLMLRNNIAHTEARLLKGNRIGYLAVRDVINKLGMSQIHLKLGTVMQHIKRDLDSIDKEFFDISKFLRKTEGQLRTGFIK